ncbi:pleckstrin homology domain-containing family M member 1-like [Dysidea avara]|uniref:pleckstrin homology domain-containing family M member 1-like n=1 Tax=Dysidea avara TaxID=196820 RepID=UPI00332F2701
MEQQRLKEWLLKGVSKATKEVQFLYAQEKKPIKECRASRHLCATFENILRNGLRARLLGFRHKNSFWPLLLKISRKQAIKYISNLQHAQSEMGRCRAWIRLAVNECALENYINVLCQDESLLSQYYEPHAFLRNQEMREALKYLLTGLSELNFDIDVDTVSLEFEAPPEALQASHLRMRPVKETEEKHRRKRRKGPKKTEAVATGEDQEESTVSTDSYTDSEGSSDDGNITDDEGTTTTTTTTTTTGTLGSSEYSPKDSRQLSGEQLPEASPKQCDVGSVVVEDIPVSEHMTSSNQSGGQIDTLCHNLEEVLPPSSDDQIVNYFENTELDTEQSVLSTLGKKPLSPVLEADSNLATSHVDTETVAVETGSVEDSDQRHSVSSSDIIIDKVIEEILGDKGTVILEENVDTFPTGEMTHINEDTFVTLEDKFEMDLQNEEEPVGIETEVVTSEEEKNKLELSDFIEEHYSKEATYGELLKKIQSVKEQLSKSLSDTSKHKSLQIELLRLNTMLEQLQEASKCEVVFGHKLIKERGPSLKSWSCDACGHKSRSLIKPHYICQECGYTCHMRCIPLIGSICISSKVGNNLKLILNICPEKSLTEQQFRCQSCNKAISYGTTNMEPQLCDYTGSYHCSECHHNQTHMIPARIVHNWDFTEHKVCCNCFERLQVLSVRPLLQLHQASPDLYNYVQDLEQMEQLRKDFIIMKNFFVDCLMAKEQKLLQKLDQWPHFKESVKLFSIADLYNIATGDLMVQLKEIHEIYCNHITMTCHICRSRGITCILCRAPEMLYPFGEHVSVCPQCSLTFHRSCYEASQCPQCAEKS